TQTSKVVIKHLDEHETFLSDSTGIQYLLKILDLKVADNLFT
ncbi:220_t:CDS:1, partial [Gigaspora rosea]